ncbi:MAG: polymerase sigma-70 factor, subfamily [Actinomycetota bacterium]|nr:polymerase sigma-70 factor, subfamily [Actinomycetota bacterium]
MGFGQAFFQVLDAARADAPWAYATMYEELAPSVCGYFRLQGAREPEDLVSETFLGVFRNLDSFTGSEAQFRSWLFTIAHRRLTDERRRWGRRPHMTGNQLTGDHDGLPPDRPGGSVEDDALRRMSGDRVRSLVETLAPDQRDVLLLRIVSDLTVDSVAEVLGKSPGAVKALQRRGLDSLREKVEPGVPL